MNLKTSGMVMARRRGDGAGSCGTGPCSPGRWTWRWWRAWGRRAALAADAWPLAGGGRSFGGGAGVMNRGELMGSRGSIGASRQRRMASSGSNYAGYRGRVTADWPRLRRRRARVRARLRDRCADRSRAVLLRHGYGYDDYAYGDGYDDAYVAAPAYGGGGDDAYCAQRFRSYDPGSGTYLGYDGLRHPCP